MELGNKEQVKKLRPFVSTFVKQVSLPERWGEISDSELRRGRAFSNAKHAREEARPAEVGRAVKRRHTKRTGESSFAERGPSLHHFKLAQVVDHDLDFWRSSQAIIITS